MSLDLDQPGCVYSLYAASAAAAAAAAAVAVGGPFPSLFGSSTTLQSLNNSVQLLSDIEKNELTLKNLLSPLTLMSHNNNNNLISIGVGNTEIIHKQDGASSAFVPCIIDNNTKSDISSSSFHNNTLPKSNVVRIVKSDYLSANQQVIL